MPTAAKVERINASGSVNAKCKMTNNNNNNSSNNNNNANNNQATNQQQQQIPQDTSKITNTIIEKKIRNLEKRKARLLDIKALEDKGQQLEPEQITAVKKLDSVVEMIEMLKEINKNVADGLNEHAKQMKKQQKKEQQEKLIERNNLELERIKLLLRIHKILPGISLIRENLSKYQNDSPIEFDEKHMEALETLARHPQNDESDFNVYAEKFVMILDGNKKEFINGLSYLDMKEWFIKMSELRIMDNIQTVPVSTESAANVMDNSENSDVEALQSNVDAGPKESQSKIDDKKVDDSGKLGPNTNKPMKCVEPADLQKADPAVIACSGYTYPFPNNVNCPANYLPPSHPNQPAAVGMEFPVAAIYSNVSMGGSIPTQTFTNQNFNGFIPAAAAAVQAETARKTQQPQLHQQQQPVQMFQEVPVMMTPVSIAGDKASMVYARDVALNGRNISATNGVVNSNNSMLETATAAIASNTTEKAMMNDDMKATSQPENDAKNHDNHANLNGHNSGVNVGGHYNNNKQRNNNYRGNSSNRGNNPARNYPANQNMNRGRNAKPFPQTGMFFPNNNGVTGAAPAPGVVQQPANFTPANNRPMNQKQHQNGGGMAVNRGGFPYPRSNEPRGHSSNNIRNNNHFNPNQGPSANTNSLVSK